MDGRRCTEIVQCEDKSANKCGRDGPYFILAKGIPVCLDVAISFLFNRLIAKLKRSLAHIETKSNPPAQAIELEQRSDKEIWDLFRSGHEGAFVHIYRKYVQDLFKYGIRFCQDRETVKDCVHDLYLDLRKSKKLKETDAIKPYLYAALRLKILGVFKKVKDRSTKQASMDLIHQFRFEVSFETKLINSQIEKEKKEKLGKALSKLTSRENELLHYFYVENFTYLEIAGIMNFNHVKSARNIIYKTIKKLRRLM